MADADTFHTLLYHQKLAHKAWLDKAFLWGTPPSEEMTELVWELLVAYGESLENFEAHKEDIYKTAYELANNVLSDLSVSDALKIYRNYLLDAMLDFSPVTTVHEHRTLLAFSNLVSDAFSEANADKLKRTIRHSRAENLSRELKIAKQIQSHLLPKVIPQVPGYEFAGRLEPAAEIGGDYWSIKHYEDDGIITMKLADITGHGVAAATLVAAVKFISGSFYKGSKSAAEVIWQTNRVLVKETPHDILVTMAYGWLRPETHELTLVNAGHSPVFICRENSCIDIPPTGPLLGVTQASEYNEQTIELKKNDILFFGSDGITEAGLGSPFGLGRLKDLVVSNRHLPADKLADLIIQTVKDYAKQPHDDISLLITKVNSDSIT